MKDAISSTIQALFVVLEPVCLGGRAALMLAICLLAGCLLAGCAHHFSTPARAPASWYGSGEPGIEVKERPSVSPKLSPAPGGGKTASPSAIGHQIVD